MATPVIQPSFAAGEVTPSLYGRVDLSKYRTGVATARNFYVDYRGGLSTRPGTALVGMCALDQTSPPRLIPFQFNTEQTYVLELNNLFMRIITNGGYIVESPFVITGAANAFPLLISAPGHNYSVGNNIVVNQVNGMTRPNGISGINGRTFNVAAVSGDVLTLADNATGVLVDASTWTPYITSGGSAERIFTVATPWASADVFTLSYAQSADVLTVAHPSYPTYDINRLGTTNWTITPLAIGTDLVSPAVQHATPQRNVTTDAQFFYAYAVTAKSADSNEESNATVVCTCTNSALNQTTGVVNVIDWSAVAGNVVYQVYKAQVAPDGSEGPGPYFYGFMGETTNTSMTDMNFSADYTAVPPSNKNPFLGGVNPGVVAYFLQRRVLAASTEEPDTFWMSRPGLYDNFDTSFPSNPADALTGTIVGQQVNAIASLTPMASGMIALTSNGAYQISGGTVGAAITPSTIQAAPQAFSGASNLPPLRIEYDLIYEQALGSGVRDFAYNFYVNVYTGSDVSALSSHLFEDRKLVQWDYAQEPYKIVWAVRDDGALLSFTYLKEQELYGWARHDTCGLYKSVCSVVEGRANAVYFVVQRYIAGRWSYVTERMASRSFAANSAQNIPADPSTAWCVDCGLQLPLTTQPANIVLAQPQTPGQIGTPTMIAIGVGYTVASVLITDPTGEGASIALSILDGQINLAAVVAPGSGYTNPTFTIVGDGTGAVVSAPVINPWLFGFDADIFSGGNVNLGLVMRLYGGQGTVIGVITTRALLVDMTTPIPGLVANSPDQTVPPTPQGAWTLTAPVSIIGGLDHLEGALVSILADGSVVPPQIVKDGCVTLARPASSVIVGQGYTCQVKTLRLDVGEPTVQGKRKVVSSVTLRLRDARGLEVGPDFHNLIEIKERDDEPFGSPISFQIGGGTVLNPLNGLNTSIPYTYADERTNIMNDWNDDGVIAIQQSNPLPATILAVIPEITIGDTPQ